MCSMAAGNVSSIDSQAFALYDFAGTNPGELPCNATDVLIVLEDDGSGWVLCQKKDTTQGYVPSSYLQNVMPSVANV